MSIGRLFQRDANPLVRHFCFRHDHRRKVECVKNVFFVFGGWAIEHQQPMSPCILAIEHELLQTVVFFLQVLRCPKADNFDIDCDSSRPGQDKVRSEDLLSLVQETLGPV